MIIVRTAVEQLLKIIYHYVSIDNTITKKVSYKPILSFNGQLYQQNRCNLKYFQTILLFFYITTYFSSQECSEKKETPK